VNQDTEFWRDKRSIRLSALTIYPIDYIALGASGRRKEGRGIPVAASHWLQPVVNQPAKGVIVERRKARRNQIQVDIEIAHPGSNRCSGYAENISRTGVSVKLLEGSLPSTQRSVILNFRVWTGNETLYRKVYARVVRYETGRIALEFAEHDFIAEAIIHDLMYYQARTRKLESHTPDKDAGHQLPREARLTA
jgi:hypothetical protein